MCLVWGELGKNPEEWELPVEGTEVLGKVACGKLTHEEERLGISAAGR